MKIYIVGQFMADDAGLNDTLKVFSNVELAKKYQEELESKCGSWEFTELEEVELDA